MNKWVRQIHRWLSITFTIALIVVITTTSADEPPGLMALGTVAALALLLLTGLYLFVLPYATKWRRRRRKPA